MGSKRVKSTLFILKNPKKINYSIGRLNFWKPLYNMKYNSNFLLKFVYKGGNKRISE